MYQYFYALFTIAVYNAIVDTEPKSLRIELAVEFATAV